MGLVLVCVTSETLQQLCIFLQVSKFCARSAKPVSGCAGEITLCNVLRHSLQWRSDLPGMQMVREVLNAFVVLYGTRTMLVQLQAGGLELNWAKCKGQVTCFLDWNPNHWNRLDMGSI